MTGLHRGVEMAFAGAALAASAPLLVLSACAVKLSSPGPAFFRQHRMGRGGVPFQLIKLRTMRMHTGGSGVTAKGDARITPVGRVLRKTKLDELPELWNVLKGDMALVGPRPELPRYVDLEDPRWRRVLAVRPGLTDPVTLRLRNEEELLASVGDDADARERFYREVLTSWKLLGYQRYLRERGWSSDLAVLLRTALAVLMPGRAPAPSIDEIVAASASSTD